MMRGYAELRDCRREFLLDVLRRAVRRRPAATATTARPGWSTDGRGERAVPGRRARRHADWGEGVVQRYERDTMIVLFDEAGYKTLAVELVERGRLLEPLP